MLFDDLSELLLSHLGGGGVTLLVRMGGCGIISGGAVCSCRVGGGG